VNLPRHFTYDHLTEQEITHRGSFVTLFVRVVLPGEKSVVLLLLLSTSSPPMRRYGTGEAIRRRFALAAIRQGDCPAFQL
jgi:hypothetical protein